MTSIGIIGGGNMGAAIMSGIHEKYSVAVCEQDAGRAQGLQEKYGVKILGLAELVKNHDALVLAVKPQDSESVLNVLSDSWTDSKVLISIAAGLTTSFLEQRLPAGARVVRTMPNMPAQIGEGLTAVCGGKNVRPADLDLAEDIFNAVGKTIIVSEDMMNAVTAVSGSGPAYVFLFAECLMGAAAKLGFNEELSRALVEATLQGSVHQLLKSKETPAQLRARVTSKGGTTQAAMDVFLQKNIGKIFEEALAAASRRAGELSK